MDYTHLGRSGTSVSRICLGTMNFGALTEPADAHVIMDRALDAGINFWDTANTYGRPRRRDKVVLATKLYGGKGEWPNDRFLSAVNIRRSCEDSLRRLGTDHIDLYQMHHVDRSTSWPEIWEAMSVLRTQGKIIYVGSGLAWLLHQPAVTAPIVGPRTLEQLEGALRALKVSLDDAALARLDTIFPGPGGSAPEAYAW